MLYEVITKPHDKELKADQSLTGPSQDSSPGPGDSMESVMDMYEESFKRFAEGVV